MANILPKDGNKDQVVLEPDKLEDKDHTEEDRERDKERDKEEGNKVCMISCNIFSFYNISFFYNKIYCTNCMIFYKVYNKDYYTVQYTEEHKEEHKEDHTEERMEHIDQDKDLCIFYIHMEDKDRRVEDKVAGKAEDIGVHKEQKEQNLCKVMERVYHIHMVLPN